MHKIFGERKNIKYFDRPSAYLIPIKDDKLAVVKLPKGLFLIGGGMEEGETEQQTIERESLEEIGCSVTIKDKIGSAETFANHSTLGPFHPMQNYYYGDIKEKVCQPTEKDHILIWVPYEELKGRMFSPMQNWAIDQAWNNKDFTI